METEPKVISSQQFLIQDKSILSKPVVQALVCSRIATSPRILCVCVCVSEFIFLLSDQMMPMLLVTLRTTPFNHYKKQQGCVCKSNIISPSLLWALLVDPDNFELFFFSHAIKFINSKFHCLSLNLHIRVNIID